MILGLLLFSISLCAQLAAAFFGIHLFLKSKSYRMACGFIALGLALMVGRRVSPLLEAWNGKELNNLDAWLAALISISLLLGMFEFKKLLGDLESRNFILDQFSKVDSLTGALSRFETFSRVELEIKKSFRSKECIAFLMADIDHFKNVNDLYGHPFGDRVLMNLVKQCQEVLREIDIFGRVGGEEFLIVLPDANEIRARQVAERLRVKIAQSPLVDVYGKDIFITISIGIAIYDPSQDLEPSSGAVLKNYFSLCDQAMYRAKNAGRNQVSE